ncbi:hypothetical protein RUM43_007331 [Polyplax serrata]|uniref:RING-type domain-containing protein n=1 Tax=Polyplax serrata TaxID=468196 RepID=A0AAN8SA59_POLSC
MASGHNSSSPHSMGSGSTSQFTQKCSRQSTINGTNEAYEDHNSDYLCPICFELIEEAHITRCGHTYCFGCITKAIVEKTQCPKCGAGTRLNDIFPNFLLNDLVVKYRNKLLSQELTQALDSGERLHVNGLRDFVKSGSQNLSLPDVNVMLEVLIQRKNILEAETCMAQNELLYEFLKHLRQQREEKLNQLTKEVALIQRDMEEVENILKNVEISKSSLLSSEVVDCETKSSSEKGGSSDGYFGSKKGPDTISSSLANRRKRMHAHFDDFVHCYFSARAKELLFGIDQDDKTVTPDSSASSSDLNVFRDNLVKFSRYNCLRPLAVLNYSSDIFNNSTIVSSIEFDKDNEFFAIAGVTKLIKIYDYGSVIRDTVDIHYPCLEMTSSSKISCVSWNFYHKGTLASSDYEGAITVWDVTTGQRTKTFQEHEKRCWSVDFNNVDTRLIASGSDDARVKLWDLNNDHSVASLEAKANVCCVKFNPCSSYNLAFGSADHCVHYYDLRKMKEALSVFKGHRKAVSYVKFLNKEDIVSASTDSQLKMWNVNQSHCLRSFVGHINEKNFVGLATDGDYVACGSENNSLYVYYKGVTKQLFNFKFDTGRSVLEKSNKEDDANEFVSAVCWRQQSNVVVAANSQGIIKILELV